MLEGTDPDKAKEWNELTITFTWEAGEPPLGMGSVTVSYHPVTDDVTKIPRFASGPTNDVIEIEDCTTTLLFPFVTNQAGLRYRSSHFEYLGGIRLLHHQLPRSRRS